MRHGTFCTTATAYRVQGFSLVEFVLVLVILGILASIAIPRFIELREDAVISSLKSVKGALHSTVNIYQPLAALRGVQTGNLLVNGANVSFHSGYPEGHWNNTFRHILDISSRSGFTSFNARCSGYRLCGVGNRPTIPTVPGTNGGRGVIIWPEGFRISERCFVYYYNRHDGSYPVIGMVDSGC
ncbi:MAG: prepilin-type N-terminal cleavage/methylation domain-containing protein [Thiohalobacterales bacterium]|nr:prepilin-type N-terminal cleavage/methylation domain-containing protein [Thiohalobacterales bacterium]